MRVFGETGDPNVAVVFMAEFGKGQIVEFVEALQPPYKRDDRYILMISTLFGCPVKCLICDAGGQYSGKPNKEQMFSQIDYMVKRWYPDLNIPCKKFKIQFARMGEPSLNYEVLNVLEELPDRYNAPGLMPSISTVAPYGRDVFFERLLEIKNEYYQQGRFQFQYSIHSTDESIRDQLIPIKKWNFDKLAKFGERFYKIGDRKITLNFALAKNSPIDIENLQKHFDIDKYLIKITPINPTFQAEKNKMSSHLDPYTDDKIDYIVDDLKRVGYEVIVSIGEIRENAIGSNCGQYVHNYLHSNNEIQNGYKYPINQLSEL